MTTGSSSQSLRVESSDPDVRGANRTFEVSVCIGRDEECEIRADASMVSRIHTRILYEDGSWWVVDVDSTNGTYVDGDETDRVSVNEETTIRMGLNGPTVKVEPTSRDPTPRESNLLQCGGTGPMETGPPMSSPSSGEIGDPSSDRSVTGYVQRSFDGPDGAVGKRTRMIRQAYQKAKTEQRRKYLAALVALITLCILLGGYGVWQHVQNRQLSAQAKNVFAGLKEQALLITKLKRSVEATSNATLKNRLAALQKRRREQTRRYEGYVQELGLHRDLTRKEREIYRVARLFGESEFRIPAGFVRRVKRKIEDYWLGSARTDFVRAVRRANSNGYTPYIVRTLRKHGLPPELFYLALQESRFDTGAVGPRTRWGIAKGMWQFIPSTARRYGLQLGPRVDQRVADARDERHDFKKSTQAAADYLQTIYSTGAQASGLLVVASYNWGEHRVVDRMKGLPAPNGIPTEAVKDIPERPRQRNYWAFLTRYKDRMPAETKDYVLKIFSAAVIGQAPELFGFSFDNPVQAALEKHFKPASPRGRSGHRPRTAANQRGRASSGGTGHDGAERSPPIRESAPHTGEE